MMSEMEGKDEKGDVRVTGIKEALAALTSMLEDEKAKATAEATAKAGAAAAEDKPVGAGPVRQWELLSCHIQRDQPMFSRTSIELFQ